jgi:hypothetical protein
MLNIWISWLRLGIKCPLIILQLKVILYSSLCLDVWASHDVKLETRLYAS